MSRINAEWFKGKMNMTTREAVYNAIDTERAYQDVIWPSDRPMPPTIGEELLLAEEYLRAARTLWSEEKSPEMKTLNMFRKIAAILVRAMEQHGAPKRAE